MAKASRTSRLRVKNRIRTFWVNLRSSLWFIPSMLVTGSAIAAVLLIEAEPLVRDRWLRRWPRLFGAGPDGAREMLSTIAGSMVAVAGVTFSITLVALSLASTQYSSRVLRNFMSSRVNQSVLGIYAGIFAYCLIVLRTIRGEDGAEFVPSLAVFFGFALALGGVGVLIFFIHHIALSIQASSIVSSITRETLDVVDRMYPEANGEGPGEDEKDAPSPIPEGKSWRVILSRETGYIQSVDQEALIQEACEGRTVLRMERGIGDFAVQDAPIASLAMEGTPDPETESAVQAAFSINRYRTMEQDAAFGIRQIVDVALKALSPSMNDTTTAVTCVDYLSAILVRIATRRLPRPHCRVDGELRLLMICPTFADLLDESFDQIRDNGRGNAAVLSRILKALETIADLPIAPDRRRAIRTHAERVGKTAASSLGPGPDRIRIERQVAHLQGFPM